MAPIVSGLEIGACSVLAVYFQGSEAGSIRQAAAQTVNAILAGMSAPVASAPLSMRAKAMPPVRVPVRLHGQTIGHVREDLAASVQAALDAIPADGGSQIPADGGLLDGG